MKNDRGVFTGLVKDFEGEDGSYYPMLEVTFYYEAGDEGYYGGPADRYMPPSPEYYEIHEIHDAQKGGRIYFTPEDEEHLITRIKQQGQR